MTKYYKKNNQPTALEVVFLGIGRGLWWLISFPFRKKRDRVSLNLVDQKYIISKRREIESLVTSQSIIELKHAVMEADKLVDFILKKKGYTGETFAERLRSAERNIDHTTYQNIWEGHKIRNQIAHDDNKIPPAALKLAINKLLGYHYG